MQNPWVRDHHEDLLSIGEFSRLSGLSIGTLRHYDSVDIVVPAVVDPSTSYRRYSRDQLETARLVAHLRDLEVPLDEIRQVLATDDARQRRALLARHRDRVRARVTRLHRILHQLGHLTDPSENPEEYLMSQSTSSTEIDPATQRSLAVSLFNRVWELMEKPDRSSADDDELVNAAHASRYHWTSIGTARHLAIGEWQISRAYTVLGRGEPAVHHARRALSFAQAVEPVEEWLLASAYEGLSRSYAVAGDRAAALEWKDKAVEQLARESDPEEREIIERDIASLPL